ncbi:MAG TPA: hypothetical protein VGG39_37065 [Polyangiaceae bacterium]
MRKSIWGALGLVAVAGVAAGVLACSGATTGGGNGNACLQNAAGSTCYACVQNSCASSLSTFESACAPFVDCMCSSGSYDGCNAQACASQISPACSSATSGFASCNACASECSGFSLDACTGSSGGGSSSGGIGSSSGVGSSSGGSCLATAMNPTCWSCLQGSCGSELGTFESDCSAYVDCVCPGGTYDACNATTCEPQITGVCGTSAQAVATCETQSCESACVQSGSSSGAGSSSGGCASSSGSSSGGTGTGTCSTSTTCPSSGETLEFCVEGSETSCYYEVGSQTFPCASCTDVTSCAQAATTACQ